ncbi:heavy-metal-associated domain-containing protein [Paeniglutamicibacter sp. NPDC012692]|uniref:heavy-metal-associated domain-containing protein n=1 Tax=Paeniglutamicibacter sp. NPDC012692 TaxID=3364388 RepID=UPI0036ADEE4D
MSNESSCGCGGCGCGSNSNEGITITARPTEDTMSQNVITLKIDGMTCGHCVASVTEELNEVPGVSNVEVVLSAGGTSTATVTTNAPVENSVLEEAVAEAGYTLVSTSA